MCVLALSFLCVLQRKGRELVAEILRQTGRDRPGVTSAGVEPSDPSGHTRYMCRLCPDPNTYMQGEGCRLQI